MMFTDRRIWVREAEKNLDKSCDSATTILLEKLGMSKVSCRWVPRRRHMKLNQQLKDLLDSDPVDFFARLGTGEEIRVDP